MTEKVPVTEKKDMSGKKWTRETKRAKSMWELELFLGQGRQTVGSKVGYSTLTGYVGHRTFPNRTHAFPTADRQTLTEWGHLLCIYDGHRAWLPFHSISYWFNSITSSCCHAFITVREYLTCNNFTDFFPLKFDVGLGVPSIRRRARGVYN